MDQILSLLSHDARMTPAKIAEIIGSSEAEVRAKIHDYEQKNIILGYTALIDQDKLEDETVTALIEVRVSPQALTGFDELAQHIAEHPQVESVYLISGGYDLNVVITARSLREVSAFVAENLAPIDNVISTTTHFILRKYKEQGTLYNPSTEDDREDMMHD
ncbi:MAG: Lrp/AsnC family transcriptional regulator [Butyricicoccaceae bacterium]